MEIDRMFDHRLEDWAIQMMATNLIDDLVEGGYIVKKNIPYFKAVFEAIRRHPDVYRRSGYSFEPIRFSQHTTDKKGKLVHCMADFGWRKVPTEKEIEEFEKREKKQNEGRCLK